MSTRPIVAALHQQAALDRLQLEARARSRPPTASRPARLEHADVLFRREHRVRRFTDLRAR